MPARYGQFCAMAKAMELLDERWTLLVVRELMMGSEHFNDLRRGVPRMSPALLSKRLHTLARAGVVERRQDGHRTTYRLTQSGRELEPVVEALGRWGVRWIPELGEEDLDPRLLLWDIHRHVDVQALPEGRTVVAFAFRELGAATGRWWMVLGADGADVCDADPGHPVRVTVESGLRTMVRVWRGDVPWPAALRSGELVLHGDVEACRALPGWLALGPRAGPARPWPGPHEPARA